MSSINTTFQPMTDTIVVDNTGAAQVPGALERGATTFRCVARIANAYLAWGQQSTVTAPSAPAAVGVVASSKGGGVMGLTLGVPCYIEVPPGSWFIGSAVFATSNIEITGGSGGTGG